MSTIKPSDSTGPRNEENVEADPSVFDSGLQPNAVSYAYNPSQAARYARKFVNPAGNTGNKGEWLAFYNRDYHVRSADCTNFVSQAIHFGGLPFTSSWYYNDKGTKCNNTSHVAGRVGHHACTDDDYAPYAWINVGGIKNALVGVYGTLKTSPSDADVKTGYIVQYDWNTSQNPNWNHSTICVGTNSSGKPIVCGHTYDYYNVIWNYGGSDTRWRVIKITANDDFGNTIGTAGNVFRSTMEYVNGKINYAGDVDYIKFTPYTTKLYRIYTTGSTDTYGQLYNSAGVLLRSDDDSGTGNNFLMKYSLTKGNSYYIKIQHSNNGTGSYVFFIHDDAINPPEPACIPVVE